MITVETRETKKTDGAKTKGPMAIDFAASSLNHITFVKFATKSVTIATVMRERRLKFDQFRAIKIETHKLSLRKLEESLSPNGRFRELEQLSNVLAFENEDANERSDVRDNLLKIKYKLYYIQFGEESEQKCRLG